MGRGHLPDVLSRKTHRVREKRGTPRFLTRPSKTPPPVSVEVAPAPPAPAEPVAPTRSFDEDDERFFLAEGSLAPTELVVVAPAVDDEEPIPRSRADRIASPRRRALARWVGGVVAAFAVFCVAAFASKSAPTPTVAAPSAPPRTTLVPAMPVEIPAPVVPPAAPPPAPETETKPDPARALALREVARTALSRGAVDTAIERGIESVEADPSDAEAWLVLGAAQMAKGQNAESRSTFVTCTKMATHGPRNECSQML